MSQWKGSVASAIWQIQNGERGTGNYNLAVTFLQEVLAKSDDPVEIRTIGASLLNALVELREGLNA